MILGVVCRQQRTCETQNQELLSVKCESRTQEVILCSSAKVISVLAEHLPKVLQQMGKFILTALVFVAIWEHELVSPCESEV